jgi:Porphobilinogen deaminase, dipyromethane cofactor binding domain/NUDIX domain
MTTASDALSDELSDRLADTRLRIGTRTTPLALAQTRRVIAQIDHVVPGLPVEVVEIQTSADLWTGDLSLLGGKGNFTKEIDRSLISGKIDIAVHSMKDVPGDVPLPKGTEFGAYLERGDVHDVVISRDGRKLADLPGGLIERDESPADACRRELREELGLDLTPGPLHALGWNRPRSPGRNARFSFIFDMGAHDADTLSSLIRLQPSELDAWQWSPRMTP